MLKAVFFDLDGTLVDREVGVKNWLSTRFQTFATTPDDFGAFYAHFQELDGRGHSSKLETFKSLAEKWHWPQTPHQIWSDYRQNVWRFCELFSDALPAIAELRALNLGLAIVTNGTVECQEAKIESLGLAPLMDAVLISEREGVKKPAAELFLRACHRLNLPPEACLMVGDSLEADVQGALNAGLQAVLLQRHKAQAPSAIRTIDSLLELSSSLCQFSSIPRLAKIQ